MSLSRRVIGLVVVVGAVVAGCSDEGDGSDGLSDEETEYVDAAMEGFDAEEAAPLTEDDAECIATSMVQAVGVDRLEDVGITPESFSNSEDFPVGLTVEDAREVVDTMGSCLELRDLLIEDFMADSDLSAEAEACFAEEFDQELVDLLMVALLSEGPDALTPDSEVGQRLGEVFTACPEAAG